MQVGNIGTGNQYAVSDSAAKDSLAIDSGKNNTAEAVSTVSQSDSVTISDEAMRLLDASSEVEADAGGEPLGNGSGTVPDLNSTNNSDEPTPGNGSGTVPPDLGGN